MKKKIAVIGGGITGLSTAYFLQEKSKEEEMGIDCILIEREKRLGGKIVTDRVGDFIIEGGPDSFLSQKRWGLELCRKLDLIDQVVQTHPICKSIFILSKGRLQKFPEGMNLMIPGRIRPFLFTPLVSLRGKTRMGFDLLVPRKNRDEDESIASLVRRRLGEEAVLMFAEPILATIYAGDVEKLSLAATFPQLAGLEKEFGSLIWGVWMKQWDRRLAKGESQKEGGEKQPPFTPFVTLRGGLTTLIQALQEKLTGIDLRSGRAVLKLSCGEGDYGIHLPDETFRVNAVVITTDTHTASDLVRPLDGALAEHLSEIPYVSTATVSLGFRREDVAHPLDGLGFVCPRSERKYTLATTWSSTKFEGRAPSSDVLIRSFLGGAHQEEVVDLPDDELISSVCEELGPVLGIRAAPTVARVFKWRKANPQYHVGHLDRVAQIEKEASKYPGLFFSGAAYKGVGIPDCIEQGFKTADQVIRFLKGRGPRRVAGPEATTTV